jgi:TRAP-type C4-dicarboxylate transport system permease large subunit
VNYIVLEAALPYWQFLYLLLLALFLAEGQTPKRITSLSQVFFGGLRGGIPLEVLFVCALFSSFSGASGVSILALGGLLYLLLIKGTNSKNISLGLIATSGSLGLIFQPSLILILYALISQVSVDQLFLAGIIPGTLTIGAVYFYDYLKAEKTLNWNFDSQEAIEVLTDSIW